MTDRIVHASNPDYEVVRYDRAGKWYIEPTDETLPRQAVNIDQAADMALHLWRNGGTIHFDRPGGATFNRKIRGATT